MPDIPTWSDDETEHRAGGLAGLVRRVWRTIAGRLAVRIAAQGRPVEAAAVAHSLVPDWNEAVDGQVLGYVRDVYLDAAGRITDALDAPELLVGEDLVQVYLDGVRNRLRGVGDDVWAVVRQQLAAGRASGEGVPELAARVKNVTGVSDARATLIARTEVHAAYESASYEQARFVDPNGLKTWLATEDERTRETHRLADGQTVPIGRPFTVGAAHMRYPGDPRAAADEVIQCRCSVIYSFPTEKEPPVIASLSVPEDYPLVMADVHHLAAVDFEREGDRPAALRAWAARDEALVAAGVPRAPTVIETPMHGMTDARALVIRTLLASGKRANLDAAYRLLVRSGRRRRVEALVASVHASERRVRGSVVPR